MSPGDVRYIGLDIGGYLNIYRPAGEHVWRKQRAKFHDA